MEASSVQIRTRIGVGGFAGDLLHRRYNFAPNRVCLGSSSYRRNGTFMRFEGRSTGNAGYEANTSLKHPNQPRDDLMEPYPALVSDDEKTGMNGSIQEGIAKEHKGTAKIHDFCFGIPFGGFVFGGGLFGFLFTRDLAILSTGFLFGGALLALSSCSLKVWRQGKSSLPFILGQAAIAALLLVKNFQMYSVTKKIFLPGFYALFSAAMLCFYFYVMMSGGNPPPKKLKMAGTSAT